MTREEALNWWRIMTVEQRTLLHENSFDKDLPFEAFSASSSRIQNALEILKLKQIQQKERKIKNDS